MTFTKFLFNQTNQKEPNKDNIRLIELFWRFEYAFFLLFAWIYYPIAVYYVDSIYKQPLEKLLYALKMNLYFYSVCSLVLLGFMGYYLGTGHSFSDTVQALIAIGNVFGLVLITSLLGYGLVAVPQKLLEKSNLALNIRHIEFNTGVLEDDIFEIKEILGECYSVTA